MLMTKFSLRAFSEFSKTNRMQARVGSKFARSLPTGRRTQLTKIRFFFTLPTPTDDLLL